MNGLRAGKREGGTGFGGVGSDARYALSGHFGW